MRCIGYGIRSTRKARSSAGSASAARSAPSDQAAVPRCDASGLGHGAP
jgi:hypothetical protein